MNKIFDFNEKTRPGGIIGDPREIAWPCDMFRVTLPKVKRDIESEFNAFELCVLKLLASGRYEPKELAAETCLPPDLIEAILLRLYDHARIDEHYQVVPDALEAIEKHDEDKESEPTEYETCVLFRERIGGTLLPMLTEANLRAEEVNDEGAIQKGTRNIHLRGLHAMQNNATALNTSDVLSVLRTMARRRRISGDTYRIPSAGYVSVAPSSEPCSLRVRMVIQQNSDWRILNPFGKGWSIELESVYQKLLKDNHDEAKYFLEWQNRNRAEGSTKKEKDDNNPPKPYDTPENRSNYPELLGALKRNDDRVNVYEVLEWALFYALQSADTKKIIQMLQVDTRENNETWLNSAIQSLEQSGNANWVRIPLPGKLRSFLENGTSEMSVVLPLTILSSKDGPRFPFHKIAQAYPDCLARIADLKKRRDEKMHGHSKWSETYGEDDRVFMRTVISTLLPSIHFTDSPTVEKTDDDAIVDNRFNARLNLQLSFGIYSFDRMDSNLQESLLQVEMFRQSVPDNIEFDVLPCINHLYAAVQCAFRTLPEGKRPESVSIETAAQKAKKAGWEELPKSLSAVRIDMIKRTLDGSDQTLGSSVVAWLLMANCDLLRQVAVKLPEFLFDIDNLLALRKHGNQTCVMQSAELNNRIQTIYQLIKIITEA